MANMASVAYAIEGPQGALEKIKEIINKAVNYKNNKKYEEYVICLNLGFTEDELKGIRLGGEISEEAEIRDNTLRFWAEERWGLQDFHELLKQKFPDINVYFVVEEPGMEIYYTNDNEGKYFPHKFYVDSCINGSYYSEYFIYESSVYKYLFDITNGKVNSKERLEQFNTEHEEAGDDDANFIYVHEFEVVE